MSTKNPSSSPPNKYNLYLEVKPFERVRVSIEALCDTKFNKNGSTVLSVDKEGLRITVDTRSSKDYSNPIGVLLLKSKSMVDFQCDESFGEVGISLSEIRKRFPEGCTADDDTLCVFNLQESDHIWFHIGVRHIASLKTSVGIKPALEVTYRRSYGMLERDFLEAAVCYYDICQIANRLADEKIDEAASEQALSAAITCLILAGAGPRRSRVLATLYKDERVSKLKIYPILEKKTLLPDKFTVLDRALF